jgi:membrane-associated phospholipid phosphatase
LDALVEWSLFHALNGIMRGRDGAQDAAEIFNAWAIFALVGVAAASWFFAPPGGSPRSKLAAAALALLANVALGRLWFHDRPFVDHPRQTVLLVHHRADNSFPSDHASVAFAVASPCSSSIAGSGCCYWLPRPGLESTASFSGCTTRSTSGRACSSVSARPSSSRPWGGARSPGRRDS